MRITMISSAETSLDSFYLTDEDLLNSPSFKDGISQEDEFWLRFYGCDIIVEACIYLRLCGRGLSRHLLPTTTSQRPEAFVGNDAMPPCYFPSRFAGGRQ